MAQWCGKNFIWVSKYGEKYKFNSIKSVNEFKEKVPITTYSFYEKYIDQNGSFDISKCNLIAYANGGYYTLGKKIGKFGFSVQKKKFII